METLTYRGTEDLSPAQIGAIKRTAAYEMARRTPPAVISYSAALACLFLTTPYLADHPWVVYTALSITVPCILLRMVLLKVFDQLYGYSPRSWHITYGTAALMMAFSWGMLNALAVYFYGGAWTSFIAGVITAGVCTGSVFGLNMNLALSRAYLVLLLTPAALLGLFSGNPEVHGLGLIFFIGLIYMLFQSGNVSRGYWEALISTVSLDAETKKRLHALTYHDPLTNLPNRTLYNDRLIQAIRDAKRYQHQVGVVVLGLDRFKKINDTLGHHAGDDLLKAMAGHLQGTVREGDTVSRLNGDTFALIFPNLQQTNDIARIGQKILDHLKPPFELAGLELFITASIGITIYPLDSDDHDTLMRNAEAAMHRVKEQGGNGYQYYEASINANAMERLQLETKLRRALERNEFVLHYQPKVDLSTGQLSGFEALIRWNPNGTDLVSPLKFIPLLEDTGLIVQVGEWVLRTACAQNKVWQTVGFFPARMAVNLSARQFREPQLAELVQRVLLETGLDAQWLELEITESMLMDNTEQTIAVLNQLDHMGVHLAIDDFGTGYSSLAYLKRMPIKTLKIDRSFVKDITTDPNDAAVVQAVIAMAHNLHLRVVAEGAETAEQVAFLRDQHCDEMQGYFFSRPLPANEIRHMLEVGRCLQLTDLDKQPGKPVGAVSELINNKPGLERRNENR